ncbi:MAG TPA: pitrilysin family protein, partial [Myxococcaceae bacterium]|nr:pitrilysin family protein [Myxococcaceae bacterium]
MRPRRWTSALLAVVAGGCAASTPPPSAPAKKTDAALAAAPARPETATAVTAALPPPGPVGPVLLPRSLQPLVSIQLRFRTGSVDDPDGQAGITALAAEVLFEGGTERLTSQQLREALFPYAAEWQVRVDKEQTTFAIRVHRDGLDTVAGLLTDALTHPRWDAAEFARMRDAVVNDIEKRLRQGDDENLGKEALSAVMFEGHRYGPLTSGHVGALRKLTLEDLRAHAARVFTRDRLSIGIAGGYPPDLQARLTAALAPLPASGAPAPVLTRAVPRRPRFRLVEKQTDSMAISIGMPWALGRGDPDWAAMSVARSAFGEHRQFNGRLMQRLREMRGLNYGDYAYLEAFVQEGGVAPTAQTGRARRQQAFSIWVRPVQNENALFALRAALYELQRSVREEPFSEEEVTRTRSFLDGYLLLFAQTDARKLGYALDDQFLALKDFLSTWRAAVPAVTAAQANEAWRRWVHPEDVQVVVVTPDAA